MAVGNVWIGRTLLETYLGRDAATRVLGGNIVRGRTDTIRAVIWYSDLQGFTRLTDTLPRPEILTLLDAYVEPVVEAIMAEGGEVLKFMGDGVLAIFGGREPADACAAALRAWASRCGHRSPLGGARPARCRGHQAVCGPARRRGALRQFRRPDAAGLHRARAGGQRGGTDCRALPLAGSDPDRVGRVRRHLRCRSQPAGRARAVRAAGRRPAADAVDAGPRGRLSVSTYSGS